MNRPDDPCTPGQTWGIFKIIQRDIRETFKQRKVTKQQASDLMQAAYAVRNSGGTSQEANDAFNIALDAL